jgi:ubiquinone/menaquinone biosynthesis C-methylase UbiE
MQLNFPDNSFDAVFMAYGLRNMPNYESALRGINRILKPGGKICIHDYCISDNIWAKAYWSILGYGFIVPFCSVISGSSKIYTYLVKSVLTFLNPEQVKNLMEQTGFKNVHVNALNGWRKPILRTFTAIKG